MWGKKVGWALMIAGLAWLIAVLVAWRFRQLRTWWLGAPPALFVAGVAVVLAIGAAVPKGFDSSRSEMENAVAQARSHPPGWSEHYGLGLMHELVTSDLACPAGQAWKDVAVPKPYPQE
ncbi:hypothetical protein, partial [Dietzia maris]|uniref:hypothetical protein n=1 Tax=Dietzia maris TaxID=37915 RepID=UPI0037C76043